MKKILIFMSVLLMLSGVSCSEKSGNGTPETQTSADNQASIEITQLMYKQEHLSFPEDMSERMGLYYHDGVKFVYKSKNDGIKIMSYDENLKESGTVTLITAEDLPDTACCCTKSDGKIIMLCLYADYDGDKSKDLDGFFKNAVVSPEMRTYSPDGELLETQKIDGFHSYEDFNYIDAFYQYGENYVISFNGGYALISADGEILDMPNEKKPLVFATDTDGKTYVFDGQKYAVTDGKKLSVDNNAKEYGEYINRTGTAFNGAGSFKLFVILNEGIFGIAPNDELVQIMSFSESNVSPSGISFACYAGDGKFIISGDDKNLADGTFIDLLTVRPDDYVENKTDLMLGCIESSFNAPEIAMMYSKQSDNYNVEIRKYEDTDNLRLDVLSGDAPDLFAYGGNSFMYRYVNMGAFANLYDYMDNKDGIKRDDILENVLQAFEYKGGLYGIPAGFILSDLLIANSDVISRDYSFWNYDEFFSIAENMPEGMCLSPRAEWFAARDGVFGELCVNGYGNWIDYDNYTCDFNNEEFIHLLNFCNTVEINEPFNQEEMDKLSYEEKHIMYTEDDISVMNKKSLFGRYADSIGDCGDFVYTARQNGLYLNNNYTYLIKPSDDRTGSISTANDMCFSILSGTDCPDGAWDFMNYVLSPNFQNNYMQLKWCFTTNKKSYERKVNNALDELRTEVHVSTDPMNTDEEQPETEGITWINKPITDEDAEYMYDFISHFNKLSDSDSDAQDIIWEECNKFMNGEISAEECAERIQNRVSLYLSEQS